MSKIGRAVRLAFTVTLGMITVLLGGGLAFTLFQAFAAEEEGTDRDWGVESDQGLPPKEVLDNRERLEELCAGLEESLGADLALHVNSMLQAPDEYNVWNQLSDISRIGADGLAEDEWLLREKLNWCNEMYREACILPDYSSILSDLTGVLNKLPEVFYTWCFESVDDVEAYGETLRKAAELLDEFAEKIKKQVRTGMVFHSRTLERQIRICRQQTAEEGVFLESFEHKLQACVFLTEEEKRILAEENRETVRKYICNAYENVISALEGITPAEEWYGLCRYPGGLDYYSHLLKLTTGSDLDVDGMYAYLEEKRGDLRLKLSEAEDAEAWQDVAALPQSAEGLLRMLHENTAMAYPGIREADYRIETIPGGVASELYQAFYFRDARTGRNYVYIDGNAQEEGVLSLYQILAHEAFPGHMFCAVFQEDAKYPRLQEQIRCMGYSEGWAIYAEFMAGDWLGQGTEEAYMRMLYRKLYDETVLCQMDIGFHALGWTLDELEAFCINAYDAGSMESAEAVVEMIANNPCAYQPYVIGYFELEDLREKYCTKLGMEESEFMEAYLRCGQAPFPIVSAYLERVFGAQAY